MVLLSVESCTEPVRERMPSDPRAHELYGLTVRRPQHVHLVLDGVRGFYSVIVGKTGHFDGARAGL